MLSDAVAAALPELRAEAEANMHASCTIRDRDGEWTTNPTTGEATQEPGAVAYSGKCRVRPATLQAQSRDLGGDEQFVSDVMVAVPVAATGIRKGMVVTIDSSPDLNVVGLLAEIQDLSRGDNLSARRMWCLEVS